jgi:hypothetical protein
MEEDDKDDEEGCMHMFDDDDETLEGGEEIGKQVAEEQVAEEQVAEEQVAEAGVRRPTISAINKLKNMELKWLTDEDLELTDEDLELTDEDLEHAFKKSSRVRVRLEMQVKVVAFKSKCSISSSLSDESHIPILLQPSVYLCPRKHKELEHRRKNRTGHHDEAGVIYTRARKVQSKYILSVPESSGGGEGQKSSVVRVCFANSVKEKKRFSRKALVNKEHYPERAMLHDSVKRKDVMAVQREAVLRSMWHE